MFESSRRSPRWMRSVELPFVLLSMALVFVSIPLARGGLDLSSDTLNHHLYLGWIAQNLRIEQDFLASSYQSYQFPYLYWPVYKMAAAGWTGLSAGILLAVLHLLVVPPVWMLARACIPGATWFEVGMRLLAVVLSFMSGVVLLSLGTTANDLLAAIPLVWALAWAVIPLDEARGTWLTPTRAVLLSGAAAGAGVALKLSNGPLAILLPLLWWQCGRSWGERLPRLVWGGLATLLVFVGLYAGWGLQLWHQFGNPIYPAYDGWFAPLRVWLGWTP